METDRIEKQILLKAPIARVWRALADADEFGTWFGMKFDAPFAPGAVVPGAIVPTKVNAEVAALQKPYEGTRFDITIVEMVPEQLFSYRWHPGPPEPSGDYSGLPTTLVEFKLKEVEGGVLVTLTESGFDKLPPERRAVAFQANEGGWTMAVKLLETYAGDAK
jgi:uncharacterized protein YndB with AHSA1/START domain